MQSINQRKLVRYSIGFKQMVVNESGKAEGLAKMCAKSMILAVLPRFPDGFKAWEKIIY